MKLNATTNSQAEELIVRPAAWAAADRSISKAELYRAWQQDAGDPGEFTERNPSSWLGRLAARFSAWLGNQVALGYEDAGGFHYGPPPLHRRHEIYD